MVKKESALKQGARVPLVRELRSHLLCSEVKKINKS